MTVHLSKQHRKPLLIVIFFRKLTKSEPNTRQTACTCKALWPPPTLSTFLPHHIGSTAHTGSRHSNQRSRGGRSHWKSHGIKIHPTVPKISVNVVLGRISARKESRLVKHLSPQEELPFAESSLATKWNNKNKLAEKRRQTRQKTNWIEIRPKGGTESETKTRSTEYPIRY